MKTKIIGFSAVILTALLTISYVTNTQAQMGVVTGSGGDFSTLQSGTNSIATMVIGTGASLSAAGGGTIAATSAPASGMTGSINLSTQTTGSLNLSTQTTGSLPDANLTTPVTQASIISKLTYTPENIVSKSTDTNLGTSDDLYPSQNAVKEYVTAHSGAVSAPSDTSFWQFLMWSPDLQAWGAYSSPIFSEITYTLNSSPTCTTGTYATYMKQSDGLFYQCLNGTESVVGNWTMVSASTGTPGIVQLSDSVSSTSLSTAPTSSALKATYDMAKVDAIDFANLMSSGSTTIDVYVPWGGTVTSSNVYCQATSTISAEIYTAPTNTDTFTKISASAPVLISNGTYTAPDTTLTGWTTSFSAGVFFRAVFNGLTGGPCSIGLKVTKN